MTETAPKLFISYCWTSEEHIEWVISLAESLCRDGVDVILDKWDLKEGNDALQFMEQMVSDPEIRKVAIICNREYARKADKRKGGVGTETQIISPEIYAKHDQDKFVAVITERDDNGEPIVPTYYKSRIYIDLSDDIQYSKNYEQLLRWIFDKRLYNKPPLGERPAFLSEGDKPSLGTTILFHRALDAVRNNKPYRSGALTEYFDRFSSNLETLRLPSGENEDFDEQVVESINQFLPYRNELIELFLGLARQGPLPDEQLNLQRFFEQLYPYMHPSARITTSRYWDFDNFKFIIHELFLYAIAIFLKYDRFQMVGHLFRTPYYIGDSSGSDITTRSFNVFFEPVSSLHHRNKRLKRGQLSLWADFLIDRVKSSGIDKRNLLQADFTIYIRDCLNSLLLNKSQHWHPVTLVYVPDNDQPFEIYAKASSKSFFDSLKGIFDIKQKSMLNIIIDAIKDKRLELPSWQFQSFNPVTLMNFDKLDTTP